MSEHTASASVPSALSCFKEGTNAISFTNIFELLSSRLKEKGHKIVLAFEDFVIQWRSTPKVDTNGTSIYGVSSVCYKHLCLSQRLQSWVSHVPLGMSASG